MCIYFQEFKTLFSEVKIKLEMDYCLNLQSSTLLLQKLRKDLVKTSFICNVKIYECNLF